MVDGGGTARRASHPSIGGTGMGLGRREWEWLNDLALWLHAQHDVSAIQRGVLERLEDAVPHRTSLFDLCQADESGAISYVRPVSTTMDAASIEAYYRTYAAQDYTTWSFTPSRPTVYRDLDLVSPTARDATPIYREWMEPQGLYYGMGCTIVANGRLYGSITLFSGREAGDFTNCQMELLGMVEHHLAVRMADLWPEGIAAERDADPVTEAMREHGITGREAEVLGLLARGETIAEIARELIISTSTVKKHINAIYRKLGVENRMQLASALWGTE